MAMLPIDDEQNSLLRDTLRQMGANVDDPDPSGDPWVESGEAEMGDDPIAALSIEAHDADHIRKIPLSSEVAASIKEPEKERVRRAAGGVFPAEEEEPTVDIWSRNIRGLGKVTVEPDEREAYEKSLLFDERFQIPICLVRGLHSIRVEVRSLTVGEKAIAALANKMAVDSHELNKDVAKAQLSSYYHLQMTVAMQVVTYNGKNMHPYEVEMGDLPVTLGHPAVAGLVDDVRKRFLNTHDSSFRLMVSAAHVFEAKQVILEDSVLNGDFSRPAGTN